MFIKIPALLVLSVLLAASAALRTPKVIEKAKKLSIDVFIESQCPASKRFLQQQIAPNYDQIKSDVVLTFVPFGKSHSVANSSGIFFECQHGPFECECNAFQSCALHLIGADMDRKEQFMVCSMREGSSRFQCAAQAGLDVGDVSRCRESEAGVKLQLEDERKTAPVIKQSGHVPTIVFDGIYSESDDSSAFEDFLKTVKEKLRGEF